MALELKSLIYISVARDDFTATDLADIHQVAMDLNALDGVTGLLLFNGSHFMQIIEGAITAIDDLLVRLLADPRHHDLEVVEQSIIEDRSFPDWAMELLLVGADPDEIRSALERRLPKNLPLSMIETIRRIAGQLPAH